MTLVVRSFRVGRVKTCRNGEEMAGQGLPYIPDDSFGGLIVWRRIGEGMAGQGLPYIRDGAVDFP